MALQADDIADLVTTTLRDLGRGKWTDIASDLQDHVAMNSLLNRERVRFDSGRGIQFNLQHKDSGAAKNIGMFGVDNTNVTDTMVTGNVPWRHCTTDWAIDRRELKMNSGPAEIVSLIKSRRTASMISMAELMESNFWDVPSSTSTTDPYGVPYWIVYSSTEGFQDRTPSGFSDIAGLDPTTYTRWRNWANQYTNVTDTDFVTKARKAATFTNFKSPIETPSHGGAARRGYYTNYSTLGSLEQILTEQNSNLGNDIASKDGQVMFRRIPVTWVPYFEDNAPVANPFYGIDWGVFSPVFLRGEYMNEEVVPRAANQHVVTKTYVDCSMNFVCYNLRRNFVLSTAA